MPATVLVGVVSVIIVLLSHTAALFYWGGRTSKAVETLTKEMLRFRDWKHDDFNEIITGLQVNDREFDRRVSVLESQVKDIKDKTNG